MLPETRSYIAQPEPRRGTDHPKKSPEEPRPGSVETNTRECGVAMATNRDRDHMRAGEIHPAPAWGFGVRRGTPRTPPRGLGTAKGPKSTTSEHRERNWQGEPPRRAGRCKGHRGSGGTPRAPRGAGRERRGARPCEEGPADQRGWAISPRSVRGNENPRHPIPEGEGEGPAHRCRDRGIRPGGQRPRGGGGRAAPDPRKSRRGERKKRPEGERPRPSQRSWGEESKETRWGGPPRKPVGAAVRVRQRRGTPRSPV